MSKAKYAKLDFDILKRISDSNPDNKYSKSDIHQAVKNEYAEYSKLDYKTVLDHINTLKEAGYVHDDNGIYICADLTRGEAQFLSDAVKCSKFIPTQDALDLIKKIYKISGIKFSRATEQEKLKKHFHIENDEFFDSIETLLTAIENNCKVQFNYHKFLEGLKLSDSYNVHLFNPYTFVMKNQHYYVVGYDETKKVMTALRVIKMKGVKLYEENHRNGRPFYPKRIKEREVPGFEKSGIDFEKITANPYLYMTQAEPFVIKIRKDAITDVIDWFGNVAKERRYKTDEGYVLYQVKASREAMLYWALQYVDVAEVVEPKSMRETIKAELQKGLKKYK